MARYAAHRDWQDYLDRKRGEYGSLFDPSELAMQFRPYFESGERIKIRRPWGEVKFGTVGVTTGLRPWFLLMSRVSAIGSSEVLRDDDVILAVKRGRSYVELNRPGMVD